MPLLFLILSAGIFFMYSDKAYEELKTLRAERTRYQNVLDQSRELISRREDIRRSYNAIPASDIERLNKFLPSTVDNVRLLLDVTSIARKRGILVSNISIEGGQSEQGETSARSVLDQRQDYGTITVSFDFEADYVTFVQFLRDLELSLRLVDVTSLSVSGTDERLYQYGITLQTYWLR